jgi:fibronectin type III domain protein
LSLRGSVAVVVSVAAVGVFGAAAPSVAASSSPHGARPVASLTPAATDALWHRLAHGHGQLAGTATTDCRQLRTIFYAQTDWRRLATKLAANASACAQYYISVPPLSDNKTQERSDQAGWIRALGANFHALAEINMSAWGTWVTDGGGSWYQAGVEARKNMAAAGFDVTQGDTWAVNEFSSGVRQGSGTARQDARDFVHGLFDGDGTLPTAKGVVWTVGMGQGLTNPTTYKTNLENWLQDSAFWSDMNAYVSDWSQEVYGDFRNYGVAGSSLPTRRDYLNDYLQHVLLLANAGPGTVATARSYLQTTYAPLANAAWAYTSGYGYTSIPYDQMENYVSAQTYALRNFSATNSQPQDRWGFAWAPTNSLGLSSTDYTNQTGAILDRLAAAIHDSAQPVDPSDPGVGACGPLGQNTWCNGQIAGAWFNDTWKTFQVWGQQTLAFASPAQTLNAGVPSGAMTVQLQSGAGTPVNATSDTSVILSSSSAQGMFATSTGGPWSATLTMTIPAGSSTTPSFYHEDTKAGSPTLTAGSTGSTSGTQTETVNAGALASIAVTPGSATVATGGTQAFTATGADAYGNPVDVSTAAWSVSPASLGTVSPSNGSSTTFTAAASASSGTIMAAIGAIQGSASVSVAAAAVPGAPTNLTAVPASGKGVQLSWTAPSSSGGSTISGYKVYRSTASSGPWTVIASVGATTTAYKDATTTRSTTYFYEVTALNSTGEGPPSNVAGPVRAK